MISNIQYVSIAAGCLLAIGCGPLLLQLGKSNQSPVVAIVVQALTAIFEGSRGSASDADLTAIAKLPRLEWIWNEEVTKTSQNVDDTTAGWTKGDIVYYKEIEPRRVPVDCKRLIELAREELQRRGPRS